MAQYTYITNPAKIKEFMKKLQGAGVPDKLTYQVLSGLGFKSVNERPLIAVMKAIGFVSDSGVPTDSWRSYRNKASAGVVLAEGIKKHYDDLFKTYPDAHLRDNEALRNFFSSHTTVSGGTLEYIVRTFKVLAEMADFKTEGSIVTGASSGVTTPLQTQLPQINKSGCTININIQLTLPDSAKPETYDALFEAMKKHLFQ